MRFGIVCGNMPVEIERKFLLRNDSWHSLGGKGCLYRQGYLSTDPGRSVRVRIAGDLATLTIKGSSEGMVRSEFEYSIPVQEALDMLETLCLKAQIEKRRYRVRLEGHCWEIDEFFGENSGLVLAEVELEDPEEEVRIPAWIGREVTGDLRYYNSSLVVHPYSEWRDV